MTEVPSITHEDAVLLVALMVKSTGGTEVFLSREQLEENLTGELSLVAQPDPEGLIVRYVEPEEDSDDDSSDSD